jgi:hypothetical protein
MKWNYNERPYPSANVQGLGAVRRTCILASFKKMDKPLDTIYEPEG